MSEELKEALNRIIESGYQLSADGFEYLETLECGALKELIKRAIQVANASTSDIVILDRDLLKTVFEESHKKPKTPRFLTGKPAGRPLASEHERQIQVLDDPPSESSGDLEGFMGYFRNRFSKIRDIFQQRIDMRDAVTIGSAIKMPLKSKLKIIGIVILFILTAFTIPLANAVIDAVMQYHSSEGIRIPGS